MKNITRRLVFISFLFTFLINLPLFQIKADEEAPKADSVWGAMRYTGYHIEKGSVTTGHAIKDGSVKAGKTMEKGFKKAGGGIKKGAQATGRGFKKAGKAIDKFFTGD